MGLEHVKDDIIDEAKEEAKTITTEAEKEANQIVEKAEQEAEKIREEAEKEIENEKESIEKKRLSNARMKARQLKLQRKHEKIDEAFREFRHELEKLDDSQRDAFVENSINKVSFEIGSVKASEDFEDAVENAGYTPEELDREGIVLVSDDGEKRQEFTVKRLVETYRDDHRKDVAEVLFQ
jgi:vacuolar-type H+-ATPase subunit E/Vma4